MLSETTQEAFAPCPAPFNMAAHVLGRSDALADKLALTVIGLSGAEAWSHERLVSAVRSTATGLLEYGLKPGDKLLMRLGNTVEFPIAYLAAIAAGILPVPTSSQLTAAEVQSMIDTLAPTAILLGDGIACPKTQIPTLDEASLHQMRDLPAAAWDMGDPNRPAYIIFTSGTSGSPRAVVHAHRAIWARQMMMQGWYGLGPDDRLCHAGAFNWSYTLGTGLMDPWTMGATALIPGADVTPDQLPVLLERYEATIFAAAPGVYRKILDAGSLPPLPKLRHGLSAGEKLSQTLRNTWTGATGTTIHEAYGMSECSTFISGSPDHPQPAQSIGRPQTGRRICILGNDGPAPIGKEGTIAVHKGDPGLMLGYLGAEDDTAARYQGEWFLTGDQGSMDADGQITYLGRSDDMMNAGGYRVSPMEVEAVINAHPGVVQSAVTDIEVKADARLIMAFYSAPAPLPEDELQKHAAAHLARYKCPRAFIHVDALPTGANGKLLRRALRPIYKDQHGSA